MRGRWLSRVGGWALATCIWAMPGVVASAEQEGDVKVVITKAEKSPTKAAADLLLVNDTGVVLKVELGTVPMTIPIGQELALKVERGVDPLSVTEYRWGFRGKPGKTTLGWIPWRRTRYDSRLGLRGMPKKHSVKKAS